MHLNFTSFLTGIQSHSTTWLSKILSASSPSKRKQKGDANGGKSLSDRTTDTTDTTIEVLDTMTRATMKTATDPSDGDIQEMMIRRKADTDIDTDSIVGVEGRTTRPTMTTSIQMINSQCQDQISLS